MNKRGSLAMTFLFIMVFAILCAGLLLRSANEAKITKRTTDSTSALWLAEAGLQQVKYEKNTNSCRGMTRQDTGAACSDCTCGSVTKVYTSTISGAGDIDATLSTNNLTIQSTGSVPSRSSTRKVSRAVQGTFSSVPIYDYGAYAKGTFFMSNNALVDSYNSNNGDYAAASANSNGSIGTNGTTTGIITMSNSALVKGNATMGTGGTNTMNNSASITGTVTSGVNVSLPSVVVPSSLTSLSSSGSINISGTTNQTINSGSYKYSSITLSNNSILTINGDVTLYVTGNIAPSNSTQIRIANGGSLTIYTGGTVIMSNSANFNNVSKNPKKLTIYSTKSSGTGFALSNNTNFYGTMYMPDADYVGSNNAELMGSLVAKTISLSNYHKIHYDESLSSTANPFGGVGTSISNWQEI